MIIPPDDSVHSVCVDDFATKRRRKYGTIIIDADTRKVINIINSRDVAPVTEELEKYSSITHASRDGSDSYAKAIRDANASIIQISDRFHLLKGMGDKCCDMVGKLITSRISVTPDEEIVNNLAEFLLLDKGDRIRLVKKRHSEGKTALEIATMFDLGLKTVNRYIAMPEDKIPQHHVSCREKEHLESLNRKRQLHDEIMKLHDEGLSPAEIAKKTGHSPSCVRRHLKPNYTIKSQNYGRSYEGVCPAYRDEIMKMYLEGKKSTEIAAVLKQKGHAVTPDNIRGFILKEKRINKDLDISLLCSEIIDARVVKKLFFYDNSKGQILSEKNLNEIKEKYPLIGQLLALSDEFKSVIMGNDASKLEQWMEMAEKLEIDDINAHIKSLRSDLVATKNAIELPNNNGLAEGKVNKLKVIKRIMFGRCSFELLRTKILLKEHDFIIN